MQPMSSESFRAIDIEQNQKYLKNYKIVENVG